MFIDMHVHPDFYRCINEDVERLDLTIFKVYFCEFDGPSERTVLVYIQER